MKKITILIALMIYSLGFAQTPEGTWKFAPVASAFVISSGEGATGTIHWFSPLSAVTDRSCLFDDEYVFNADGTFQNVLQAETWLEPWQGVAEGCGAPIAPHDNSNAATWAYSSANGTLTVTGVGAFVGLNKVINGAELASLASPVPASRTYKVAVLTETNMTLDIEVGGNWWRFNFTKKLVGQPVIESLIIPSQTLGDIPYEITDPKSDSPGAFSYTSSNTAVATVSGNTLFPVGPGKTTITATQAASTPYLTGAVSTEIIVYAEPITTAASTPPARNAGDVISIYSGAYTDLLGTNISQIWGQSTVVDEISPEGNATKRMVFFNYQGVIPAATMNVTGYKLHIDIYKTDMTAMEIALINPGPVEKAVTLTPTVVGWNSFDIDVDATNFPGIDLANVFQMKLGAVPFGYPVGTETTYWDNLYFWKGTALGVSSFEKSNVKMYPNPAKNTLTIDANSAINRVSVYNVLGQEVMKASPKSNSVTLQTSELQKGVYMVTTEIDGKISTSKVVKE